VRILFVMRHSGYVRNFESTLRMLCDRGHRVHVAFQNKARHTLLDPVDTPRLLAGQYSNFSYGDIPARTDGWGLLGRELRLGLDYLRYLTPAYEDAPKLRERATRAVSPALLARVDRGFAKSPFGRRLLGAWLRALERSIPRAPEIDAFMAKRRPDVLAAGLQGLAEEIIERAAPRRLRRSGLRTGRGNVVRRGALAGSGGIALGLVVLEGGNFWHSTNVFSIATELSGKTVRITAKTVSI